MAVWLVPAGAHGGVRTRRGDGIRHMTRRLSPGKLGVSAALDFTPRREE
jgi:hypothetical protein